MHKLFIVIVYIIEANAIIHIHTHVFNILIDNIVAVVYCWHFYKDLLSMRFLALKMNVFCFICKSTAYLLVYFVQFKWLVARRWNREGFFNNYIYFIHKITNSENSSKFKWWFTEWFYLNNSKSYDLNDRDQWYFDYIFLSYWKSFETPSQSYIKNISMNNMIYEFICLPNKFC